jgi:hypothetical protein
MNEVLGWLSSLESSRLLRVFLKADALYLAGKDRRVLWRNLFR